MRSKEIQSRRRPIPLNHALSAGAANSPLAFRFDRRLVTPLPSSFSFHSSVLAVLCCWTCQRGCSLRRALSVSARETSPEHMESSSTSPLSNKATTAGHGCYSRHQQPHEPSRALDWQDDDEEDDDRKNNKGLLKWTQVGYRKRKRNAHFTIIYSSVLIILQVPPHLKFNPYIHDGYRPLTSCAGCIKSLAYFHNETVNILTHGKAIFNLILGEAPSQDIRA